MTKTTATKAPTEKRKMGSSAAKVRSATARKTSAENSNGKSDYSKMPLFLYFPPGANHTFFGGVLRKTYNAHQNTTAGFVMSKMHPVLGEGDDGWAPTAERHDIVLPSHASDADRDIPALVDRYDREMLSHKQTLLVYLTLRFPDAGSLQRGWEMGRAFALRQFALKRGLATVMVQHAPHRVGSSNAPHLHLMVLPRRLTGLGFGAFDDQILYDGGLEQIHQEWRGFERRWR